MKRSASSHAVLIIATAALALACTDTTPTTVRSSVLRGLSAGESNDTTASPPPPTNPTPGSFQGFVLGPGTPPDTVETAPRLANVAVTAYPLLGYSGEEPNVGESVGSVVTGSDGAFQFPTIPGGEYVVTFVPPASGLYRGVYVTTTIHEGSNSGNWWVILPRK